MGLHLFLAFFVVFTAFDTLTNETDTSMPPNNGTIVNDTSSTNNENGEEIQSDSPHNLTLHVITIPIVLVTFLFVRRYPALREPLKKYHSKTIFSGSRIESPYKSATIQDLAPVANIVSNNLRNLIAIYGILLAFIVSTKLSIAFHSWAFSIWAGWVLAVILRAGYHGHFLADILVRETNAGEVGRVIHIANLFYKHAIYSFLALIALSPVFFFVVEPETELPFEQRIALGAVALPIIVFCMAIYWLFVLTRTDSVSQLYLMLLTVLVVIIFAAVNESPLKPVNVIIFNTQPFSLPSSAYWVTVSSAYMGMGLLGNLFVGATLGYVFEKVWPKK